MPPASCATAFVWLLPLCTSMPSKARTTRKPIAIVNASPEAT